MKKILSVILCVSMLFGIMQLSVSAEESAEKTVEPRINSVANVTYSFYIDQDTGEAVINTSYNSPSNLVSRIYITVKLKRDFVTFSTTVEEWNEESTAQSGAYEFSYSVQRGYDYIAVFEIYVFGTNNGYDEIEDEISRSYR